MTITDEELELFKKRADFDAYRPASLSVCTDYFSACCVLLAHIDAQAAKVESLTTQLSIATERAGNNFDRAEAAEKKLEALRAQEPYGYVAESPCSSGYGGVMHEFSIERLDAQSDAAANEGSVIALYSQPLPAAPVAVPEKLTGPLIRHGGGGAFEAGKDAGWNACIDEVLRLNSGSKQFVVKNWPTPQRHDYQSDGEFWGAKSMLAECVAAINAAGGSVSDE